MRKWPLLIPNAIAVTCLPFICLSSCNNNEQEKKEIPPESIEIWYGEHQQSSKTIYEGDVLDFQAKVLPEEAEQQVTFVSSNTSVAKFDENNNLTPTGVGITNITAYPFGYPGFVSKAIQITVDKVEDYTKVDTSSVVVNEPIITGLSSSYGITLSSFKVNFNPGLGDSFTAKIRWTSDESMEDDAAGIANIKLDSFFNAWFDVICSFKPDQPIEEGHTLKFVLDFYFAGEGDPFFETEEYSIIYSGESQLVVDDSEVTRIIDFNHDDYLHASLQGFKANFDFGPETNYQLKTRFSNWSGPFVFEIVNKQKEGDWIKFDLNIERPTWYSDEFEQTETSLIFLINNIEVFITPTYQIIPIDNIVWTSPKSVLDIQKEGETPRLLLTDFQSNFDFSTEFSNLPALTLNCKSVGGQNAPASCSILNKRGRTFDVEILWEKDTTYFDQTRFIIQFFLEGNKLYGELNFLAKYTKNSITFNGNSNVRIGYYNEKYFSVLSGFINNFTVKTDLIFVDLTLDNPTITEPNAIYQQSVDSMTIWNLYLYWDEEPDFSSGPITGNIDISYNGELLLDDLRFEISQPPEDNYYDISLETSDGQMDILKNKKDETIEIGIKNIDLTKKQLCGYYVLYNSNDLTSVISTYEYDTVGDYKIKISVEPSLPYFTFSSADKIVIGAIFNDDSATVVDLTKESQLYVSSFPIPSLQTAELVSFEKDKTYYIKADLSQLTAIQDLPFLELGIVVCAKDLNDESTWEKLNEPIHSFGEKQGLFSTNLDVMVELNLYYATLSYDVSKAHITIVWKPDRNINDVYFALAAGST